MKHLRSLLWFTLACCSAALGAQAALAPQGKAGEIFYLPYPHQIKVDGSTEDWAGVPRVSFDGGNLPSQVAGENGPVSFALCSDGSSLYVWMEAVDATLVSGKHGADSWNEDSLEFYFNFGSNFSLAKYNRDCVQYRIMPKDIGNADPAVLSLGGTNLAEHPLRAKVFRSAKGWGFEGSVALPAGFEARHGLNIGFQAQLNGATDKDRIVKLIWSSLDKADNSWQNPSLFGRAIFYRIGESDLPPAAAGQTAAPSAAPAPAGPRFALNQYGYLPEGPKTASVAKDSPDALAWRLVDAKTQQTVAQGQTGKALRDPVSGDLVHSLDFSAFKREGSYRLVVDGLESNEFRIAGDLYQRLARDALAYFYLNRSGIELSPELAGKAWARPAGHLSDADTPVYGGAAFRVNGLGGWYDAGDFGKYLVNGGISVWTLQNAWERMPRRFADGAQAIPENRNKVPDILDEARWELDFLLRLQIPAGQPLAGMAFHKLHDLAWSGVPAPLPSHFSPERYAYEPSTAATLNLAAVAAQAARLWKSFDPAFAARCLAAAQLAWKAAQANPALLAGNVPGSGGGNYDDPAVGDEFFWAAAELYASTGSREYLDFLKASPFWKEFPGLKPAAAAAMGWGDTAALGSISLVSAKTNLAKADLDALKAQLVACADRYLATEQADGYRVPLSADGYVWGSNSLVLNNALVMAVAADLTQRAAYREGVLHAMDYLLGHNGLYKSYISGYGANSLAHPHHRVWANDPAAGHPAPPPGALAGGPNASLQDPAMVSAKLDALPIGKRYLDQIESYATNEVAINWNAPLSWVSAWLSAPAKP